MNTILMSIRPEYLVKILNHEKTIELRKSVPLRFKPPFKVVMYCTKGKPTVYLHMWEEMNGKVVGEFICDKVERLYDFRYIKLGNESFFIDCDTEFYREKACLTVDEMNDYCHSKGKVIPLFALHISNVVAYDKPKEIGEFKNIKAPCEKGKECQAINGIGWIIELDCFDKDNHLHGLTGIATPKNCGCKHITKAPQSWQMIEDTTAI